MAQFTLSVTVEYPDPAYPYTGAIWIKNQAHYAITKWANSKGVQVVIEDMPEDDTADSVTELVKSIEALIGILDYSTFLEPNRYQYENLVKALANVKPS